MKLYSFFIPSCLLLGACTSTVESAKTLAEDLKTNVYETSYKIKDWAMTPPASNKDPKEVANAYCYQVLQDILCYRQPMPGWENKLVGYQGTHATTPPPAQMQLMAKSKEDPAIMPANKVASAKPVFTTLPDVPKPVEKNTDAAPIDASHEALPDPSKAPEL